MLRGVSCKRLSPSPTKSTCQLGVTIASLRLIIRLTILAGEHYGPLFAEYGLRLIYDIDRQNSVSKIDLLPVAEGRIDQHVHCLALLRSRLTKSGHWEEKLEPREKAFASLVFRGPVAARRRASCYSVSVDSGQ